MMDTVVDNMQPGWNGIVANLVTNVCKQPKWIVSGPLGAVGDHVPRPVDRGLKLEQEQ